MNVQVEKLKTKGSQEGPYPVGFKISGVLVDASGVEIDNPLDIPRVGMFLRTETTRLTAQFPYQFATDTVFTVQRVQPGKYNVDTISALWLLTII